MLKLRTERRPPCRVSCSFWFWIPPRCYLCIFGEQQLTCIPAEHNQRHSHAHTRLFAYSKSLHVCKKKTKNLSGLKSQYLIFPLPRAGDVDKSKAKSKTTETLTVLVSLSSRSGLTFTAIVVIIPTISGGGTVFSGIT